MAQNGNDDTERIEVTFDLDDLERALRNYSGGGTAADMIRWAVREAGEERDIVNVTVHAEEITVTINCGQARPAD